MLTFMKMLSGKWLVAKSSGTWDWCSLSEESKMIDFFQCAYLHTNAPKSIMEKIAENSSVSQGHSKPKVLEASMSFTDITFHQRAWLK